MRSVRRHVIQIASRIVFVAALTSVCSCAGITKVQYSKPHITDSRATPSGREKGVGDMFVAHGIAYAVYPANRTSSDLMLLPVPFITSNEGTVSPTFAVGVGILSDLVGSTLDAGQILYSSDISGSASARRLQGPFPCNSSEPRPPTRTLPVARFPLPAGACIYLWLEFDIPAPDPSSSFTISVGGIAVDSMAIDLPAISFGPDTKNDSLSVP
jgi:hypothetical protein